MNWQMLLNQVTAGLINGVVFHLHLVQSPLQSHQVVNGMSQFQRSKKSTEHSFSRKSTFREHFNNEIDEKLDAFHCLQRLGQCCSSEVHPGNSRLMVLLSNTFFHINESNLQALHYARNALGWSPEHSHAFWRDMLLL